MCFENEEHFDFFMITLAGKERFHLFSHGIFASELLFLTSVHSEPLIQQKKPSGQPSVPEKDRECLTCH